MAIIDKEDKIRVRYSVIVNYMSKISRFIMGLAVSFAIARSLSPDEYGLMGIILSVYNMILYGYSIWNWWMYRYYARGHYKYASVSIFLNIVYAPLSIIILVMIGFYYYQLIGFGLDAFLISALLLIIGAIHTYLEYIARASRPYLLGYSTFIAEISRAFFIILFLYLGLGLNGVIIGLVISKCALTFSYIWFFKKEKIKVFKPKYYKTEILTIIKNSYIQIISFLSNILRLIERPLVTLLTNNIIVSAFLTISYIPRSIITGTTFAFTAGLSTKLLKEINKKDIEDTIRLTLLINTLQFGIMISFAIPILSLLNPYYISGWLLFVLYSIESYIVVIAKLFLSMLSSIDRSDLYTYGKHLMKSDIFFVVYINFIRNFISIILGSLLVYSMLELGVNDPVYVSTPYPIIWVVTATILLIISFKKSKQKVQFSLPITELKATTMGLLSIIAYSFLTNTYKFIINDLVRDTLTLLIHIAISGILYFVMVLLISDWAREFVRKVFKKYIVRQSR